MFGKTKLITKEQIVNVINRGEYNIIPWFSLETFVDIPQACQNALLREDVFKEVYYIFTRNLTIVDHDAFKPNLDRVLTNLPMTRILARMYRAMKPMRAVAKAELKYNTVWLTLLALSVYEPKWFKTRSKYIGKHLIGGKGEFLRPFTKHWKDYYTAFIKVAYRGSQEHLEVLLNVKAEKRQEIIARIALTIGTQFDLTSLDNDLVEIIYREDIYKPIRIGTTYRGLYFSLYGKLDTFTGSNLLTAKREIDLCRKYYRETAKEFLAKAPFRNLIKYDPPKIKGLVPIKTIYELASVCWEIPTIHMFNHPKPACFYKATIFGDTHVAKRTGYGTWVIVTSSSKHSYNDLIAEFHKLFGIEDVSSGYLRM